MGSFQGLILAALLSAALTGAQPAFACDVPDDGSTPWRRAVAKVRYLPETESMVALQASDRSVVRYILSLDDPRRVAGRCWWPVEVRVDGKLWKRFLVTPQGDALREDRARR